MEQPRKLFKVSICNYLGLTNVKRGHIEMTKKSYIETLKSVLGLSISQYYGFLHLKDEKYHSHLAFRIFTTVEFIYYLFQGFSVLITYNVACLFIYSVQKRHCYLSVSNLASKNMSGTLFLVCLSLNTFFRPFSGILTCKYIKHISAPAVYTLITRSPPYCVFLTTENAPLTFHAVIWPSKREPYLCCNFQTSKYVRQ